MPASPVPHATADRAELDRLKLGRFRDLLRAILPANAFYAAKLGAVPLEIESLAAIGSWPFTTKTELVEAAAAAGVPGNLTWPVDRYVRFHQTSGTHGRPLPVYDTAADWEWWMACWETILDRAGIRPGERVLVASSFGPYAGFWSCFDAVVRRGAMALPGGGLSSPARLELARTARATVLVATPSYALHLAEVAAVEGPDLGRLAVRLVIVAGEPGGSLPAVRARIASAWNAEVLDHAGATEVGPWGVGDAAGHGLEVIEPWFHAEFIDPVTGREAAAGALAELVLTTLGRYGAPVLRYRTGDLVRPRWPSADAIAAGGRPWVWLEGGVVGRADDMRVIRGVNVFPTAIDEIVRGFSEIAEYRMIACTRGSMDELLLEIEGRHDVSEPVARELHRRLGLRVEVTVVPSGSLPRFEGKARRFIDRRPHGADGRSETEGTVRG